MKSIRAIDTLGNPRDLELDEVPRIGELVMLEYGRGGKPVEQHYLRVKDVLHNLEGAPGRQVQILLGEEPKWTGTGWSQLAAGDYARIFCAVEAE